jgi:copper(I)-binding protein
MVTGIRPFLGSALVVSAVLVARAAPATSVTLEGPAIVRNADAFGPTVEVAAYVRLRNNADRPDKLISLSTSAADRVEIHSTSNGGMHVLPSIDLPAAGELEIAPGGPVHLMLIGVRHRISPGDSVDVRFMFERAAPVELDFVAVENSKQGWAARDNR